MMAPMATTTVDTGSAVRPHAETDRDLFARAMGGLLSRPPMPMWDPVAMGRRCALYALCATWHTSLGIGAPSWRASTLDQLDRWAASAAGPVVVWPGGVARSSTVPDPVPSTSNDAGPPCPNDANAMRHIAEDSVVDALAAVNERLLHALVLAAVETGCAVDVAAVCPHVGVDIFTAWPTAQVVAVEGDACGPLAMDLAVVLTP
ncbi:hypothetical protein psal_cds_886 [Pandoravirus salinus]|uniref:Uncharacterized protein n=1 Tax=Pandoravirus salinus TaxID=1349410 RepID=A0A291ATY0_9VIRU|nr:hypothetical protein psal_cds_886 [Pandoravirus salinus]ATE82249.1 hypothetical protein psal_cds_886 [Pandoravirus salinus]